MAGFDEYRIAAKARDIFRTIAQKEIDKLRPVPGYGTVIEIDRVNRRARVRFPGDGEDTYSSVGMGSVQPLDVGQTVRVAGIIGDRFIDDVMGPAYVDAGGGAGGYEIGDVRPWMTSSIPTGWVAMQGQSTAGMDAAIVSMYGATLPDLRDRSLLGASATKTIGSEGGAASVSLSTSNMPSHTHTGPSHVHTGPSHTHGTNVKSTAAEVSGYGLPPSDQDVAFQDRVRVDGNGDISNSAGTGDTGSGGSGNTGSAGSGTSFSVLPPYRAVHWIVKIA